MSASAWPRPAKPALRASREPTAAGAGLEDPAAAAAAPVPRASATQPSVNIQPILIRRDVDCGRIRLVDRAGWHFRYRAYCATNVPGGLAWIVGSKLAIQKNKEQSVHGNRVRMWAIVQIRHRDSFLFCWDT